jgi:hypothetical protein
LKSGKRIGDELPFIAKRGAGNLVHALYFELEAAQHLDGVLVLDGVVSSSSRVVPSSDLLPHHLSC